jgi:hypothetical protein
MTTTTKPMTEKQFSFAIALVGQIDWTPQVRAEQLLLIAGMDFYSISTKIDELKAAKASGPAPKSIPTAPPLAYVPPKGHYLVLGKCYKLAPSKLHGGMLVFGADPSTKGAYFGSLTSAKNVHIAEALATAETAYAATVAFGQKYGKCGVCGKTLTDPESIAKKIGPVCAKKYGY